MFVSLGSSWLWWYHSIVWHIHEGHFDFWHNPYFNISLMGLPGKKGFANEKFPFPQITMGAFSEENKLLGKISPSYSQKNNFRCGKFFSKVFKNGFIGSPKVILWPQTISIFGQQHQDGHVGALQTLGEST